jgi:hypothetical protein
VWRLRGHGRLAMRCWVAGAVACVLGVGVSSGAVAALPDGRGYELASSGTDKDVMADTSRTRAAAGMVGGLPMAATFSSLAGFGDVRGAGVATEFLAQRTGEPGTSGWAVHGITPPQEASSYRSLTQASSDPVYPFFSAELTDGLFRAWSPIGDAPNVADAVNLYARHDIRTAGAGSYELLTDAVTVQPPPASGRTRPFFAGASGDVEHVVFESRLNLTADATGGNIKLYKSDGGVVRLVHVSDACPGQIAFGGSSGAPCSIAGIAASGL